MTNLLITGCAGFIGSNFCGLFEREFEIIGVDILRRGSHPENISKNITFRTMNISSEEQLSELFLSFPRIEGIINFAAETHVDYSLEDDRPFWETNVNGVRNLAKMAIAKKIRFLHVSTDEVYGPSDDGQLFSETDRLNPRNPYAASKAAADLLLLSYHKSYGLNCVISRGCNTIGPRQSLEKVVPKAISHFLMDRPFPLYKTPAKRFWLSVEDHCRAILAIFKRGRTGEIYNVCAGPDYEIETESLVDQIRSLVGKGVINKVQDRLAYDLRYAISSDKIQNELAWGVVKKLPEIIRETVGWYQKHLEWIEACSSKISYKS